MVKMSRDWKMKRRTIHDPKTMSEGESVVIRSYYGDADRQKVLSASFEYRVDEQGQTRSVYTLDRMHAVRRTCAVVSWTLKDEDGYDLPFTTENLLQLPAEVAQFIDEEISADWGGLGVPAESKEEAENQEKEAKEERETFRNSGLHTIGGPGQETDGRPYVREGTKHSGPNGADDESQASLEGIQDKLVGSTKRVSRSRS